MKNKMQQAAF